MSNIHRLPNGDVEAEVLLLTREDGTEPESLVLFEQVEHEGRKLLVLVTPEQFQEVIDADPNVEEPLDVELIVAEEIDGMVVEIDDPEIIALVEGIIQATEGDPDAMDAAADHLAEVREAADENR